MRNLKFNILKTKESDNRIMVSEEQIVNARRIAFNINKKLLIALLTTIIIGCEVKDPYETVTIKNGFNVIIVDSCEYLYKKVPAGYAGYGFMAHKGNCRFCKERKEKELKELMEK